MAEPTCDCGGRPYEIGGAEHKIGCTPEPSDEAAPAAWFEEHLTWDTFKDWDSDDFARELVASDWLAADRQRVAREAVSEALALEPAEQLALTVGSAQVERGEAPMDNIAIACVLTLMRLAAAREAGQ